MVNFRLKLSFEINIIIKIVKRTYTQQFATVEQK